ncbi:hypothetical protein D3C72_1565020 [compost metagenome]
MLQSNKAAYINKFMKKKIAFSMIMAMITTFIISFLLISINVGFGDKFMVIWIKSWAMAYIIAVPAILIIAPRVEKLVNLIIK